MAAAICPVLKAIVASPPLLLSLSGGGGGYSPPASCSPGVESSRFPFRKQV